MNITAIQQYAWYYLKIGDKCVKCGKTKFLVRHHPDYTKPDEIITLCRRCHSFEHKEDIRKGKEETRLRRKNAKPLKSEYETVSDYIYWTYQRDIDM